MVSNLLDESAIATALWLASAEIVQQHHVCDEADPECNQKNIVHVPTPFFMILSWDHHPDGPEDDWKSDGEDGSADHL
jgi:hypothetical protein